jgi:hypothetical protein
MIHPGLAALERWDTIEYAAGYRARLAAIPDSEMAHHCWRCGWEDADTEALELDRHNRVLADGGEDDYAETGVSCSMPAATPGRMEFRSMRAVPNPGKKVGSPRTSMLGWQALKTNPSKKGVQRALHCRCGREKLRGAADAPSLFIIAYQENPYSIL